jgi:putative flippase GtrA
VVSILSNVILTIAVMTATGLPVVAANIIAVAIVSSVNFWVNDRLVFRP